MHGPMDRKQQVTAMPTCPVRRRLVTAGAAVFGTAFIAKPGRAAAATSASVMLSFRHTHTGEALSIAYRRGATLLPDALARVRWLLRDFRNGATHAIDPQLLDQLHTLADVTGTRAPFEVISGYRSPATNEALQRRGRGVATRSLHLEGRAIDVRLSDVALSDLRDAAMSLRAGGVGFYPQSAFVHLDTGGVRYW